MGAIGSTSNASNRFDTTHQQGLQKLVSAGNEIISYDVIRIPDVNQSTDSHIVTALVKSKNGNYTVRSASFSSVNGEYKQRNNFSIFRQLKGYSQSAAQVEYEDFKSRIRRR